MPYNKTKGVTFMPELNNEIYDFSKESDLKEKLWERMQERIIKRIPLREEITLESISPQIVEPAPDYDNDAPQNKHERSL